jgi:hypothetical protein
MSPIGEWPIFQHPILSPTDLHVFVLTLDIQTVLNNVLL